MAQNKGEGFTPLPIFYPLIPDCATPSINCFWKMKNNTMIGITAITAPAICIGYLVVYCPCRVESAGPSVIIFGDVLTINGHMKSFHANFAVKITSETIPGFVSGSMIFQQI